jgi:L,D-peptidoglycan transpeptidase YkuD (ErfK/YbiS/YcfS/YnhG family)
LRLCRTAVLGLAVVLFGCRTAPVPPEVREADVQELDLRRAGASSFAGPEHAAYVESLNAARRTLARENLKLGWFRDYEKVRDEFAAVLQAGSAVRSAVQSRVAQRASALTASADAVRRRLRTLDELTLTLVERGAARNRLTRASLALVEADGLIREARFEPAAASLEKAANLAAEAERAVIGHISRYLDPAQVSSWQRAAEATIADSKRRGVTALIVSKLERRLAVYRNGRLIRTFDVGLGFNGLADKRFAGDNATPEGRYTIIRKIPSSLYYKALLIDYPNEEDRRLFAREKARGAIPRSAAIGGNIEIHGGGQDSLTRGCISLDNEKMDELYGLVAVGTPVTIIGTLEIENYVIKGIRDD